MLILFILFSNVFCILIQDYTPYVLLFLLVAVLVITITSLYDRLVVSIDSFICISVLFMTFTMCLYITITILLWVLSIYPFNKHYTIVILS